MSFHSRHSDLLSPAEIATCGAMSSLAVTLAVLAAVTPFTLIFRAAAVVPLAMIAVHFRLRATVATIMTTLIMALTVGGLLTAWSVIKIALLAASVGILYRHKVRWVGALCSALILGFLGGLILDGALWVLSDLRELYLESARTSVDGYIKLIGFIPFLSPYTESLSASLITFFSLWWLWIPISKTITFSIQFLLTRWLIGAVFSRLTVVPDWDPLVTNARPLRHTAPATPVSSHREHEGNVTAVVPVVLEAVSYSYPAAANPVLTDVSLTIHHGEFVAVTGPNGSGKSTLALILAGALPSAGRVCRPTSAADSSATDLPVSMSVSTPASASNTDPQGSCAALSDAARHEDTAGSFPSTTVNSGARLGEFYGTAFVSQRSELHMLGETVAEDVLWGLTSVERQHIDLDALIHQVGLDGLEDAVTRHLSGGQMQRLALAGALARQPSLLISDESTAMIDQTGRQELIGVLRQLSRRGTAVVHITHDPTEIAQADRVIRMRDGRVVFDGPPNAQMTLTSSEKESDSTRILNVTAQETTFPEISAVTDSSEFTESETSQFGAIFHEQPEHLWADRVAHTWDVGTPWENAVLRDVSFILSPGQGLLITGGNGSGKTTLSRILTGLVRPTWGQCTLGGTPMSQRVGDVALSMQFARLQLQRPSVSLDILAATGQTPDTGHHAGRRPKRGSTAWRHVHAQIPADGSQLHADSLRDEQRAFVERALHTVGLEYDLAKRNVDELSGGQLRRVALAGLLAGEPKVLVLDEPLAGLDQESREHLIEVLEQRRRSGLAILVISHDTEGLETLCQDHLALKEGVLA